MKYKHIIQKDNYKIRITVYIFTDFSINYVQYKIRDFEILNKGKRKWRSYFDELRDNYEYRSTDYHDRSDYLKNKILDYCTIEDIQEALKSAYESIAPNLEDIDFNAM